MNSAEPPKNPALQIRAVDAMTCIAAVYRRRLGRDPLFAEVKSRFDAFVDGGDLSAVLEQIETEEKHETVVIGSPCDDSTFATIIRTLYRDSLGREASDADVGSWYEAYVEGTGFDKIAHGIIISGEAASFRRNLTLDDEPDGVFVQKIYETVLHRGAAAGEVVHYSRLLASRDLTRQQFLAQCLREAHDTEPAVLATSDSDDEISVYGCDEVLTRKSWNSARDSGHRHERPTNVKFPYHSTAEKGPPSVSILTSLYRGRMFIDAFLENMTSQSIFDDCELIIIDAASPDDEGVTIEREARLHPNVIYRRLPTRIGVYAAWNYALSLARGVFVTNANVDDCRRCDSLEQQAGSLQCLPFVDIVHQDVFYSLEPNLPFEPIAAANFKTNFPSANPYSLMEFNSPHNAPMWRRALHDDVGLFDESLESAGDFDFWLRCAAANKQFYKLNEAHVAYYRNPDGVSSRPDTAGYREGDIVKHRHARTLVSPELTMSLVDFDKQLGALGGQSCIESDRLSAVRAALLKSETI